MQRVLITAGASGIGLAMAKAFVKNGARVRVTDVDPVALASAIESLVSGKDRLASMSAAARQRAGEVFDVNFNVRSVEKVYRDLLA